LPAICEIAKECIAEYNLEEQIEVKAVDIFTDEWPSGHDAVFFTHLGQKSFEVLPSGGRIYLHELLLEDTRVSPPTLAVYSLGLSFATRGKLFTAGDLNELLTGWGFEDISITHTYGYHSLITGRKP